MYSQTMILYAINRPILHNDILKKIKKQKKKEYSKCRKNSSPKALGDFSVRPGPFSVQAFGPTGLHPKLNDSGPGAGGRYQK